MQAKIQKWGNSLALRIPRPFAAEIGLEENSRVDLTLQDGKLVVTRVPPRRFTLDGLLAEVTDENLHREVNTRPAVGGEEW